MKTENTIYCSIHLQYTKMSYQFYYKSKLAGNRGEVLEHLQSQKANSSRLSQPKQSSKNQPSKSHRRKISRRRLTKPLSAARNRPTAATIINGTTREATEFFKARRQEREKRLAAIGGFKRPDTASARRGSRAMTISASTPALSSRDTAVSATIAESPTTCWRKKIAITPIKSEKGDDKAKRAAAGASDKVAAEDASASPRRRSTGRSGDGPATREHQQKLVKVAKRATAFTRKKKKRLVTTEKKKRLMTTQFRHHRAKLNRESVINMNHNKRILRLIERHEKLEALQKNRIMVNEKAKLERKEQRRLKWIQEQKRNEYLWEMNNYMSRGRSKPKSKHRPFLKQFEEEEAELREGIHKTYADLYI